MLKVGITGGMGSGKSVVAKLFSLLGIPVYYADTEAKKLMETHPFVREKIIELFGSEAYMGEKLNRSFLAGVAFSNPNLLQQLNAIVHPVVLEHGEAWMTMQTAKYAVKEAALLFESGSDRKLDVVIGVWAPKKLRLARIVKRDGMTKKMAEERMARQMNEREKMKHCHFVIKNDEKHALIEQVLALHTVLLQKHAAHPLQ